MTKKSITDVTATIVDELTPLESDERQRVVRAALVLLGDAPIGVAKSNTSETPIGEGNDDLPPRARMWMKQNALTIEQVTQVFQIGAEGVEVIAAAIPGKTNREKVRNAYILLGIAGLLSSGEAKCDDKAARGLCESSGFFDGTNHMKYMKGGNEFVGSREKGWTVTAPGLKQGATLVSELSKQA